VLYRRIFGRSRPVTVEFLGVWVSLTPCSSRSVYLPESKTNGADDRTLCLAWAGLTFLVSGPVRDWVQRVLADSLQLASISCCILPLAQTRVQR
jgi:hypothetical protein